ITGAESTRESVNPRTRLVIGVVVVASAAVAALTIMPAWDRSVERVFSQLTSDPGLTTDPTISPDGKLLAYASDRDGGPLHLWVQQADGIGLAIQRTHGPADDHQLDFSPDGSRIAFRSERDGGGVYVVPTLAGEPRLIAKFGRDPKFSPDGRWLAYWVGSEWGSMLGVAFGKVFVVPSAGGEPRRMAADFAYAGLPLWSPDGTRLLICGNDKPTPQYSGDWWVVPLDGGSPVRAGAVRKFSRQGISLSKFSVLPYPRGWKGNHILFSAKLGDSVDVWRVPVAAGTGMISGPAEAVTRGAGFAASASESDDGRVVFANILHEDHLWTLPIKANRAQVTGPLRQLTESGGSEYSPSLASTEALAFTAVRAGKGRLAVRDLRTGQESLLPELSGEPQLTRISPDGTQIAYSIVQSQGTATGYLMRLDRLVPQRIHDECDFPWDWLSDGRLVCLSGPRVHGHLIDLATRSVTELMSDFDDSPVYNPSVSSDGRWLLFGSSGGVFVASFRGLPIPKADWTRVLGSDYWDEHTQWSPDGNLLYFTTGRDGARCVWAQRLDPSTKNALGAPWPVYHFHSARRSIVNVGAARVSIVVRKEALIFPLGDLRGNIWIMRDRLR
ncbi:MAG: serine/threonine protein kinase, partial [Bryobacterales bacterium]|nr:serine/threonine protein kinase [Bryobacterales bacterium]